MSGLNIAPKPGRNAWKTAAVTSESAATIEQIAMSRFIFKEPF